MTDKTLIRYGKKVTTQIREKNGVKYIVFPDIEKLGVVDHLFSTRIGGVSKGDYATMNLSYTRGDDKECVDENYRRIAQILGHGKTLDGTSVWPQRYIFSHTRANARTIFITLWTNREGKRQFRKTKRQKQKRCTTDFPVPCHRKMPYTADAGAFEKVTQPRKIT